MLTACFLTTVNIDYYEYKHLTIYTADHIVVKDVLNYWSMELFLSPRPSPNTEVAMFLITGP